jgi:alkylation response protein AidB-like acyl-CoA dehydrogenase
MDLRFSAEEETFRDRVRAFLEQQLSQDFSGLRGRGGPGDEEELFDQRLAWERFLGRAGWNCLSWPETYGGGGLSLMQEVIFFEEYARAAAPGRLGHIGEGLLGPTLIALGSEEQKQRFLPAISSVEELWCQGYSEPGAGSDLAGIRTRAERVGDEWVIHGQKVWTSHAQRSDWCFLIARTQAGSSRHAGLSYLLVPMDQPGIEIRPIIQPTQEGDFNEVFFDGARTEARWVVGEPGDGWKVAMATLAFERGTSTLAQQLNFANELEAIIKAARANGALRNQVMRQRISLAQMELSAMRWSSLRMLSGMLGGTLSNEALTLKLYWANWHRRLGELAMDVLGVGGDMVGDGYDLSRLQRMFLFSRADTIYAGSNQIQRNLIAERGLGLPKDPWRDRS